MIDGGLVLSEAMFCDKVTVFSLSYPVRGVTLSSFVL